MSRSGYFRIGIVVTLSSLLAVGSLAVSGGTAADELATPTADLATDSAPPTIAQPPDLFAAAADRSGATVSYLQPSAVDETDGTVGVGCRAPSDSVFPLGQSVVTCSAADAAGNGSAVTFAVVVADQTPPLIAAAADIVVNDAPAKGAIVEYSPPTASDNVDGAVAVSCDVPSGSLFPIGRTPVTCGARDNAGNAAAPVAFLITVNPAPEPTATEPPAPTVENTPTVEATQPPPEPSATATDHASTPPPTDGTGDATATVTASGTAIDVPATTPNATQPTPAATAVTPDAAVSARPALELPWPPPESFTLVLDGGPIAGLAALWRNQEFPITQEFGHTEFSISHGAWYAYGRDYGLDGYEHTGLDIGMPAGTPLYAAFSGTVKISGGVPYFTFYGNGDPGVGELQIEMDNGNVVILGHMGRIVVNEGERVEPGQFLGLSGGDNGDHLHLETRELQPGGGYRMIDPRKSFLVDAIEKAARHNQKNQPAIDDQRRRVG